MDFQISLLFFVLSFLGGVLLIDIRSFRSKFVFWDLDFQNNSIFFRNFRRIFSITSPLFFISFRSYSGRISISCLLFFIFALPLLIAFILFSEYTHRPVLSGIMLIALFACFVAQNTITLSKC